MAATHPLVRPLGRSLLAVLLCAPCLSSQDDGHWSDAYNRPGLVGRVFALGTFGDDLIAGGDGFQIQGNRWTRSVARFDGARWHAIGNGVNDTVRAIGAYNGELIIGGAFTYPVPSVARWDGSAWRMVGSTPFARGTVFDVAVYRGELYVGGEYDMGGGRAGIARFDGTQWRAVGSGLTAQHPSYTPSARALFVHNDRLYVGGRFSAAGGRASWNCAIWDGSSWNPMGAGLPSGLNGSVWSFELFGGDVHAGFDYDVTLPNGQTARKVASWDEGTSTWTATGSGMPDVITGAQVFSLEAFNGALYAAGRFVEAGGVPVRRVARWDGSAWHDDGGVSGNLFSPVVLATTVWRQKLIVGGEFDLAGRDFGVGQPVVSDSIASFDGTDWDQIGKGLGINVAVYDMTVWNGDLVAVGRFNQAGRSRVGHTAILDGDDWSPLGDFDSIVTAAIVFEGDLVATGLYRRVDGQAAPGMARNDGTGWVPMGQPWGSIVGRGYALAIYRDQLYVGGDGGVLRFNGSTWEQFAPQLFGTIRTMAVYDDKLYMGGTINAAGYNDIAAWDGTTQTAVGGGVDRPVYALTVYQGDLIVGGQFLSAGGVSARRIARWDGSTWRPFGSGPNAGFGNDVLSLAVLRGELYAGGQFNSATGDAFDYVARYDGSRWNRLGAGSGSPPTTMLPDERLGRMYMAGVDYIPGPDIPARSIVHWEARTGWTDLGNGLPGGHGPLRLRGFGALTDGEVVTWLVAHGDPGVVGVHVLGSARNDMPFLGGTLVPATHIIAPFVTGTDGGHEVSLPVPSGLGAGITFYEQVLLVDGGAPQGIAFSNAISTTSR